MRSGGSARCGRNDNELWRTHAVTVSSSSLIKPFFLAVNVPA